MQNLLNRIAQELIAREEERKRVGESLRNEISDYILTVEEPLTTAIIGAVDGSIIPEEYGPIILLLIRSVGALFHYEDLELKKVEYIPSPLPDAQVVDNDRPLEREDYHPFRSLNRLSSELSRALEVLQYEPDFLFLDGSIVPLLVDKPHDKHLQNTLYRRVVSLYKEIYGYYPKTLIGGIVKDSRGNRFGLYLKSQGFQVPNWQDISWLNYVLKPGEYTLPIPYSEDPENHPTLRDLDQHSENIYIFFLKASLLDRPYRVEFYSKHPLQDAKRLASLLYPFSTLNPHYSIPPFLVEVDLRARLSRESMSYVKSYLEKIILARFPSFKLFERRPL